MFANNYAPPKSRAGLAKYQLPITNYRSILSRHLQLRLQHKAEEQKRICKSGAHVSGAGDCDPGRLYEVHKISVDSARGEAPVARFPERDQIDFAVNGGHHVELGSAACAQPEILHPAPLIRGLRTRGYQLSIAQVEKWGATRRIGAF